MWGIGLFPKIHNDRFPGVWITLESIYGTTDLHIVRAELDKHVIPWVVRVEIPPFIFPMIHLGRFIVNQKSISDQ